MLDEAVLAAMNKLNRIFHGNDVVMALKIGVIHHRGESCRFPRSGGAGHEHETFFKQRKFFKNCGQAQIVNRHDLGWNQWEHSGDAVFLLKEIGAVSSDAGNLVTKVNVK